MAMRHILQGVSDLYKSLKENKYHSSKNSLLPEVQVARLIPSNSEFLSIFEEEEEGEDYLFIGFDEHGEPQVQFPLFTNSEHLVENFSEMHRQRKRILHKALDRVTASSDLSLDVPATGTDGIRRTTSADALIEEVLSDISNPTMSDLHLSIEDEVDESDVMIETADCDFSYSDIGSVGCGLPSENFKEYSGQHNGLSRPHGLTELTSQLLDLNNKNGELEKKLTKLKEAYEAKVAKILEEKKSNESKIQETLQKIQRWQDNPTGLSTTSQGSSSGLVTDIPKKAQTARKRTAKNSRKSSVKKKCLSSSKDSSSARKAESNVHDPEPMVNMDALFDEGMEYENTELMDNINAELVSVSDLYSLTNNSLSDLGSLDESEEESKPKKRKGVKKHQPAGNGNASVKKATEKKPVVYLNDIYAHKKATSKYSLKCGSYVVVKLSSKKTVKHYCAVVRNKTKNGEYEVQYMERKNKLEFIFPEKEIMYKVDNNDIVSVLDEPVVSVRGLRVYYSFPNGSLDQISCLK